MAFSHRNSTGSRIFRQHRRLNRSQCSSSALLKILGYYTRMAIECRRAIRRWIIKWDRHRLPARALRSSATKSRRAPFPIWVSAMTCLVSKQGNQTKSITLPALHPAEPPRRFHFCISPRYSNFHCRGKRGWKELWKCECRSLTLQVGILCLNVLVCLWV